MKMMSSSSRLFLFFAALALLALISLPARADTKEALEKKMTALNDAHREMFATGDFAKLDPEMNKIELEYEKGQWTDNELLTFFKASVSTKDPAFEDLYNKWVAAYPNSYAAHFARGAYYFGQTLQHLAKAGQEVTVQGKHFLALSIEDNTAARALTAKPLLADIDLIVLYALDDDRVKSKAAFDHANQIDPRNVMARYQYIALLDRAGANVADMQKVAEDARKIGREEDEISLVMMVSDGRLFRDSHYGDLDREMNRVQKNYEAGKVDDETLDGYFGIFRSTDAREEQGLDAWIAAYPKSYAAWQARCTYFLDVAWAARGSHYIKDMSVKELQGMALYLKRASEDCRAAEALAQKPILAYRDLMTIAQMGGTYETRKQLLDLAHVADPRNIVVRAQYMSGLQPQWGGSLRQMEDFVAQAKQEGVSEHGLTRLNRFILDELGCDTCRGTAEFSKIGTVITGF